MKQFELQKPISQLFNALKSFFLFACELFQEKVFRTFDPKIHYSEKLVLWRLTLELYQHCGYTVFLCTPGFFVREKKKLPPPPPTLPGSKSLRISSVLIQGGSTSRSLTPPPKYLELYDHLSQEPCNIARGMLTIKVKNHGIDENENIG